jgi:hypothetical protein
MFVVHSQLVVRLPGRCDLGNVFENAPGSVGARLSMA